MDPSIAIVAPTTRWAKFHVLGDLRRWLLKLGFYVDLYRGETIDRPELVHYDRIVTHFGDYDAYRGDFFQDELRHKTWVFISGYNHRRMPWEAVDHAIAQSRFIADDVDGIEPVVCHAGVDTDVFYPDAAERLGIGFAGNLSHGKWMRDVYAQVNQGTDYHVISHDGRENYLPRPNLRRLYSTLECYLHLSKHDGGGLGIIEAAACGAPVVSTPVGYAPEIDGVVTVGQPGDYPDGPCPTPTLGAVTDAIEKAIEAGPIIEEIRRDWAWSVVIQDWVDALELA